MNKISKPESYNSGELPPSRGRGKWRQAFTHSTEKLQMAVGDSEHHPEEGTTEERERETEINSRHNFIPNFFISL